MLDSLDNIEAVFPANSGPFLIVVVDTEEEFDWARPLSRSETAVAAMRCQDKAQQICEKYGVRPTYLVDYPVASQPDGYQPLRDFLADDRCVVGAHLHPWVNPPFDETVKRRNSYPGNLAPGLERVKLSNLVRAIEENLAVRPTIYRAGRYGVGRATTQILDELGFEVDMSVVPRSDFRDQDGPDFSRLGNSPYWFGANHELLEIPLSVSYCGLLAGLSNGLYRLATGRPGQAVHLPGILARTRLFERIRLTPEGITAGEHRRLTEALLKAGQRVLVFTYHSPSLMPGCTPYVRDDTELGRFLDRFERYFDYFLGDVGGTPATPGQIRRLLKPANAAQVSGGSALNA
ncbi:MAG: polysaccharide deacetylase family protein [Sphingomonadales bacterium]